MIQFEKGNKINAKMISKYLEEHNLSKSAFCKICKISPHTLEKVLSESLDFSVVTLFKISSTIGVQMYQLFE